MRVVILFGSEMGTAEAVAGSIADVLASAHDVSVYDMADFAIEDLELRNFHIVVCSTYGDGELPTGAEPFFDAIDAGRPDLRGLRFAVFGLGDSVYGDTFNRGGELAAEKLTACGGTQLGKHGRHDASSEVRARDMACEWARQLAIPELAAAG